MCETAGKQWRLRRTDCWHPPSGRSGAYPRRCWWSTVAGVGSVPLCTYWEMLLGTVMGSMGTGRWQPAARQPHGGVGPKPIHLHTAGATSHTPSKAQHLTKQAHVPPAGARALPPLDPSQCALVEFSLLRTPLERQSWSPNSARSVGPTSADNGGSGTTTVMVWLRIPRPVPGRHRTLLDGCSARMTGVHVAG